MIHPSHGVNIYVATKPVDFRKCQGWTVSLEPGSPRITGEHSIGAFLALLEDLTPEQMAENLFGNRQRTSSRSGILKAEAVRRFALALQEAGVKDFPDLTDNRLSEAETRVRTIPGQSSGISFDYFLMLAGDDNRIKPDRMVQRYIAKALEKAPQEVTPDRARALLQDATQLLVQRGKDWSPRRLDYATWNTESANPKALR